MADDLLEEEAKEFVRKVESTGEDWFVHEYMAAFARTAIASAVKSKRSRVIDELESAIHRADTNPYDADSAVDGLRSLLHQLRGENNGQEHHRQ